ncbi:hypothetical protein ABZ297_03240, partial [Nonomuraea sp. NPDC005983]|uniref:hypothetical protein n=1 Tax=Nonomuraea sp. NPDC005983 TaxID=3155595 RepID=UPI0033BE52F4
MPVAAQVLNHALHRPGRTALRGAEGEVSYADLARRVRGGHVLPDEQAEAVGVVVPAVVLDLDVLAHGV